MGIKLEVYLKRTGQTMESWMDANGVIDAKELMSRCSYVGLSASPADVILAADILKKRKQKAKEEKAESDDQPAKKPKKKDVPMSDS